MSALRVGSCIHYRTCMESLKGRFLTNFLLVVGLRCRSIATVIQRHQSVLHAFDDDIQIYTVSANRATPLLFLTECRPVLMSWCRRWRQTDCRQILQRLRSCSVRLAVVSTRYLPCRSNRVTARVGKKPVVKEKHPDWFLTDFIEHSCSL